MAAPTSTLPPAPVVAPPPPPVKRRQRFRVIPWVFAGPAAVLFVVFFAYPLGASLFQSFTAERDGASVWVGFDQYRRMASDPAFLESLFNVGLILVIQVPLMVGLALLLAGLLNQSWLRFRGTWRAIYFLPAVTTLVAYAVVFQVLLKTDGGLVNQFLSLFGAGPVDWLNDPTWARISLIASLTWRWAGYNAVILLAGLQAIGKEQYEAAALDGAGTFATYRRIIVPQLRPVILFCAVTSTIGTLQLFDENYVLTRGGPDNATLSPVVYLYKTGFEQLDFGYAAAIAWVVVALIAVLSLAQFFLFGREKRR
ncbi:lactose ABC transporter permease [Streptomyces spiroverticillatus]|uniref:Lactose ABC transporter permease n=1 Tax=Streptomyces finlayi TaxID=67296 RepID=A0A918WZ02_9ACTN|nr:sugar ABC transporter permease [Streptomyces finlayi]GHA15611.1 lactose ABC transporter permease [Streptomyces spiroverticillatus]GHC96637.1 lactose ABC transporter permease [Streptomyces finlayi]